ncbi:unnamed protein product [Phyllotreta striolata]|uniref:Uncharacterized protein n=1 Tax=Phyllotreta striolata TaxID=444603 RepID=A0A9N9TF12_PHYSR|nr:unnamed protein product [Phyllotreta striolata]
MACLFPTDFHVLNEFDSIAFLGQGFRLRSRPLNLRIKKAPFFIITATT